MKIRMPAKKLANADVNFLSLVERGANRTPFKIQKQERSMINFGFGNVKKSEEPQASIVAYVVQKTDRDASFEEALGKSGAKVDQVVEDGDVVLYKQDETVLKTESGEVNEELCAVKLSPDFAVVMKGFDPHKVGGETSFTEILKSQGFMPGFSMAAQALVTSINNTMTSSDDRKVASKNVGDALDEFGEYVHNLVKEIPSAAFKSLEAFQTAKADTLKLAAALSDAEKEYAAGLEGGAKFAFFRASPEERAKMMGAKKPADKPAAEPMSEDDTKLAAALSDEEKAHAATLEGADKFKFFRASPEDRAAMMGKKKPAEKPAEAAAPAAAAPAAAPAEEEMKKQKTEKSSIPAQSAVDNGSAAATSEALDAKRVDGQGGEPSAVANMSVGSEGYDAKTAPRGGESAVDKAEIAKMITTSVTEMAKALSESLTKSLTDALSGVQKQVKDMAATVESASTVAKEAMEATKKMDKTLSTKVLGGDSGGDPVEQVPAKKMDGEIGAFDTAFRRDVRKSDKAAPARSVRRLM